jgi:cobalt-zinc-cadmium efflux system outer membrane protein
MTRRYWWLLLAGWCAGCAGYPPRSLPPPPAAVPPRPLDVPRLRVQPRELRATSSPPVRIDLADGLDPDEAAVLAVLLEPGLVAARDARGEADAQVIVAGILPNPVLGVEFDHPYGPGSRDTSQVVNVTLGWDLKPLLARSAHRRAAEAGALEVDLGIAWQEWQVAEQARLLVVRLQWLRRRIKLGREELAFEEQTAVGLHQARKTGDATIEQVGVQLASLEGARRAVDELEQAELGAESDLRALLGNPRIEELSVPEARPAGPVPAPDIAKCLEQRMDLQALERGYQAQQAALRAAVLDQFPDLTVGIAHQHDEASLNFIGVFVDIGLPLFDTNQGQTALALATRRRLEHEYDARVAAIRADLDRLARHAALVARQLARVRAAVPLLEQIEREERSAVARGDIDRLSYQTVRAALFDQRLQEAALSQALAESQVGTETACGATSAVKAEAR